MAAPTSAERSIELVREFQHEIFTDPQRDHLSEIQSDDYVQHGPMLGMEIHGIEETLDAMRSFRTAFPDLESYEDRSFASADGEFVCSAYTYRGTHDGEFMGIPATGVSVEIPGMVITRVADGEVAEAWALTDFLDALQQIGAVPQIDRSPD